MNAFGITSVFLDERREYDESWSIADRRRRQQLNTQIKWMKTKQASKNERKNGIQKSNWTKNDASYAPTVSNCVCVHVIHKTKHNDDIVYIRNKIYHSVQCIAWCTWWWFWVVMVPSLCCCLLPRSSSMPCSHVLVFVIRFWMHFIVRAK